MHLSYDGIVFDVLHLEDWMREAVYTPDQTTFLYWHHQIVVTCLLNVDATPPNLMPEQEFGAGVLKGHLPGAPGQVINSKIKSQQGPAKATPRTDLKPSEFAGIFAAGETVGINPFASESGFGGGGDFAPGGLPASGNQVPPAKVLPNPAAGAAIGGGTFVPGLFPPPSKQDQAGGFRPLPAPPPGFHGGGDFSPFKKRPPRAPKAKFAFGPPDPGQRNPFGPVGNQARATVPHSDVELRNRLRRPRRQLLVWLDSGPNAAPEYMLVSPVHPEAGCDALHGPVCTIMDVPEIHGNVTAVLRLKFDTWEAPPLEFEDQSVTTSVLRTPNTFKSAESKVIAAARVAYDQAIAQGKSASEALVKAIETARQKGLKELTDRQVGDAIKQAGAGDAAGAAAALGGDQAKRRILRTPALLSNRWTMSFGWNPENYLRHQSISGEAVFRMDVLHMRGLTADQLRGYLWHPIPSGYRRLPIEEGDVVLSPGGNSIQYRIADEQVMMNFPGGVQFGMIHADVQTEMVYTGYNAVNLPGGSDAWGKNGGSRMRAVPKHTSK